MFKKLLAVIAAMLLSATTFADVSLSGEYEGSLDDSGNYTQDVEVSVKGTSGDSTVTVTLDENGDVDDLWVETTLGAFVFKLGDYSGADGIDDDDADVTKFGVSTKVGNVTITVDQEIGKTAQLTVAGKVAGIDLSISDVLNSERETTATVVAGGVTIKTVHSKVTAGNNLDTTVSTTVAGNTLSVGHDSNSDGTSTNSASVSREITGIGTVKFETEKTSADVKTNTISVKRGIWTVEHKKVGSADGETSLKASFKF